jgi:hypothetical protein
VERPFQDLWPDKLHAYLLCATDETIFHSLKLIGAHVRTEQHQHLIGNRNLAV